MVNSYIGERGIEEAGMCSGRSRCGCDGRSARQQFRCGYDGRSRRVVPMAMAVCDRQSWNTGRERSESRVDEVRNRVNEMRGCHGWVVWCAVVVGFTVQPSWQYILNKNK
jgi:hypothetical protein